MDALEITTEDIDQKVLFTGVLTGYRQSPSFVGYITRISLFDDVANIRLRKNEENPRGVCGSFQEFWFNEAVVERL